MTGTGSDFWIKFWGVRGSMPRPGTAYSGFGGNTACVEVGCDGRILVFDAGSGASDLGDDLVRREVTDFDLFLTHAHLDHIVGLPFFSPFFRHGVSARVWAGDISGKTTTREMVGALMSPPFLPITPDIFSADIDYRDFSTGEDIDLSPRLRLKTACLNHPGGATGYRIEYGGRVACYVTDTEHVIGKPDKTVLDLIEGADLVIYDCAFTDEEFLPCKGFGHSTWREGVALCETAGAGRLVAFHHHTKHTDDDMTEIETSLQSLRPGSLVAREGMVLEV